MSLGGRFGLWFLHRHQTARQISRPCSLCVVSWKDPSVRPGDFAETWRGVIRRNCLLDLNPSVVLYAPDSLEGLHILGGPLEELESLASEVEAWSTVLSLRPPQSATSLFQLSLLVSDMIYFTVVINIFLIKKT